MKLTNQQQKVYDYIRDHRGCTSHDITRDTFVQKPCARISELRDAGVEFEDLGKKKYPGTQPFTKYGIKTHLTERKQVVKIVDGRAIRTFEEVAV